jgi:CubicO group peptidase (beta-lactamase class C family)
MSKQKITENEAHNIEVLRKLGTIGNLITVGKVEYQKTGSDAATVTIEGVANFRDQSRAMLEETISGIGSITKQFTAATLIKLWDEDLTKNKNLREEKSKIFLEGVDTKLSNFMFGLEAEFPECEPLFNQIKSDESYSKITLRDLLNHTHGLGGRNEKEAYKLVRTTGDRPLELSEIINITKKTEEDAYGRHNYSNFGFDLAAMIIEVVARQPFDEVVRGKILQPNGLNSTHPQSDHIGLYEANLNLARGYIVDGNGYRFGNDVAPEHFGELNFNTKSTTRAAGGFKSTVGDLARFARLYMGAEMFENEEVKSAVKDYDRGAATPHANQKGQNYKYHLAMFVDADGSLFHNGDDVEFISGLKLNRAGEVNTWLVVGENLTTHICNRVLAADGVIKKGGAVKKIQQSFYSELSANDNPKWGSEKFNEIAKKFLDDPKNKDGVIALELLRKIQALPS